VTNIKAGLVNIATCERCHDKEESVLRVLRDCKLLAEIRFSRLGIHFMESSDHDEDPLLLGAYILELGYATDQRQIW
jgi:hypothetical protein